MFVAADCLLRLVTMCGKTVSIIIIIIMTCDSNTNDSCAEKLVITVLAAARMNELCSCEPYRRSHVRS